MIHGPEKDVNEVIPKLWLGNKKAAYNRQFIETHKIKNILTIMDNFDDNYKYNDIIYLVIPIRDEQVCERDMIGVFDTATSFIFNSLKNNENILIHCKKGHHRSAAIVAAFLIKYLKVDYYSSLAYINKLRPYALVRKTCMSDNLFKYYLHINNTKSCNKACGIHNRIYACKCTDANHL